MAEVVRRRSDLQPISTAESNEGGQFPPPPAAALPLLIPTGAKPVETLDGLCVLFAVTGSNPVALTPPK